MRQVLLVRFGEVHLKGQNRPYFLKKLTDNVKHAVKDIGGHAWLSDSRIYVADATDMEECIRRVTRVFGVFSVSPAWELDKNYGEIEAKVIDLEGIKSAGVLVVGCDPTIEGVCYLDPVTSEVVGFIPEIINGFAEGLGVEVRWETLEWSAMLTAVNSGKVDMIAANMNMTLERASQIVFSDPYFVDHGKGLVMADSQYASLDDLAGLHM